MNIENATYSDDYIEYWCYVYQRLGLAERSPPVGFEDFLAAPHRTLRAIGQESAPECIAQGFEPLLPRQAEIALAIRQGGERAAGAAVLSLSEAMRRRRMAVHRAALTGEKEGLE